MALAAPLHAGAHRQRLPVAAPRRVLACGAWLKNTACLLDGAAALWSPLHDDLGDPAHCAHLEESVRALLQQVGGRVDAVAHDLHPDFHSTRLAQRLAAQLGVPAIGVQHHHAHIAVVQAEQGLAAEPLIGLALDGVGLGSDGTAWGGELLLVAGARWQRLGHLPLLALPGGDTAAREPWRMAASLLHATGRADEITTRFAPVVGETAARTVRTLLDRGLNCPRSSSAGRWFDAVAGLLGVSVKQGAEAEAAIALERLAAEWLADHPGADAGLGPLGSLHEPEHELPQQPPQDLPQEPTLNLPPLNLLPLAARWCAALPAGVAAAHHGAPAAGMAVVQRREAAHFHLALAAALVQAAAGAARARRCHSVVLGGGCFHNRVLRERVEQGLRAQGLDVKRPDAAGCGDAGLALGQAWAAAWQLAAGGAASTSTSTSTPTPA